MEYGIMMMNGKWILMNDLIGGKGKANHNDILTISWKEHREDDLNLKTPSWGHQKGVAEFII
jgi:hypothetical protein